MSFSLLISMMSLPNNQSVLMIIKSIDVHILYSLTRKITVDLNVYKTQRSIRRPTHLLLIITRQYQPMNLFLWVGETSILESVGYKFSNPQKKIKSDRTSFLIVPPPPLTPGMAPSYAADGAVTYWIAPASDKAAMKGCKLTGSADTTSASVAGL